jgi:hypothetical protein
MSLIAPYLMRLAVIDTAASVLGPEFCLKVIRAERNTAASGMALLAISPKISEAAGVTYDDLDAFDRELAIREDRLSGGRKS